MSSISVKQKKRGRPATGTDPITGVRLPEQTRAALLAYIAAQPEPRPSQSDVIRAAVAAWLREHGYPR
jgi:Arc/MetJ-type ribon-helix-helix transcriptional regulator